MSILWCIYSFCKFSHSFCRPSVDFIPDRPHWGADMSRGHRRNNTNMEDTEEDSRAAGLGEPESDMMAMVRALMEEQRRADIAREDCFRLAGHYSHNRGLSGS